MNITPSKILLKLFLLQIISFLLIMILILLQILKYTHEYFASSPSETFLQIFGYSPLIRPQLVDCHGQIDSVKLIDSIRLLDPPVVLIELVVLIGLTGIMMSETIICMYTSATIITGKWTYV